MNTRQDAVPAEDGNPSHEDAPQTAALTLLMQLLMHMAGTPASLQVARQVPHLSVDTNGNVLDYDHANPWHTAQLLIEQCKRSFGEFAVTRASQSAREVNGDGTRTPSTPMTLVVVDDHVLVREGLVSLIDSQQDMRVLGQAGSVNEAITLTRNLRPDVLLIDFTLPDGTGDEAARVILSTLPNTKIVFLTVHDDDARLFAAISAGAMGYLLKSIRSADLLSRLRNLARGEVALSPSIGRRLLEEFSRRPSIRTPQQPMVDELTERESKILRLIVQGHTNRQIADEINLSVRTVEYHRANLMSKLDLRSRADLVRYAAEHGLFDKT